jgi:multidrug efflux pump
LNLLTLLAVVLSVGLVVDDAIVMVENVERHIREGRTPINAALLGARELVGPIIAMTITLATVYAPIAFQGGLTGSLFREFALTLAGAVFISGIVALTLSPVMASRLLSADREEHGLPARINRGFDKIKLFYGRVLDATLRMRPLVYVVWICLSVAAIFMYQMSPNELAPTEDQGVIFGIVDGPANATIEQAAFYTDAVNADFEKIPEMAQSFQLTMPDSGFSGIVLKPWGVRKRTVFQIQPQIQTIVNTVPGIRLLMVPPSALPGGDPFPIEFVMSSTAEPSEILPYAKRIAQMAATNGMFAFPPIIDTKIDQPEVELVIDRDKVATLGLDLQSVGADLGSLVGGNYVNRFNLAGRSYKVIPQLQRDARLNVEQLENTYVHGPNGQLIPVSTFAHLERHTTPRSLNRFQQLNSVQISGMAIVPMGTALKFLEDESNKIIPAGYRLDYKGESRQLKVEGNKFLPALILSLVLIFLVLAAQFNSFRDPCIILFGSVPLAMFSALIFCFLKMPNPNIPFWTNGWTTTMNIYSEVGLVTLVGLVSKNGILIVQFANELQRQGRKKIDAIREASLLRLRPVLMTSVATVAGHFPLTMVTGAGAAARNSIGLVIVSGMALGTLFTLLVIPSVYVLIAKQHTGEKPIEVGEDLPV